MKFILLSDVHLLGKNPVSRIDDLVETQLDKLLFVLRKAWLENATILQAGDLFDRPRNWLLLPKVAEMIKGTSFFSIFGQHDTYLYSEETRDRTCLGVLEKAGVIKILGKSPTTLGETAIYGCSFGQEIPTPEDRKTFNILVIHADISDRPVYPGHEYADAEKFLSAWPEYDLIHCADIHIKFAFERKGRHIINTGPLLRKEASEYNMTHKPSICLFDTEKRTAEWIEVPHLPGPEVLDRGRIERETELKDVMNDFIELMKGGDQREQSNVSGEVSFLTVLHKLMEDHDIGERVRTKIAQIMERGTNDGNFERT